LPDGFARDADRIKRGPIQVEDQNVFAQVWHRYRRRFPNVSDTNQNG
jgi:hypothetical protein